MTGALGRTATCPPGILKRLAARAEDACRRYHQLDQPGAEPTHEWFRAWSARHYAVNNLRVSAADHPIVRREDAHDRGDAQHLIDRGLTISDVLACFDHARQQLLAESHARIIARPLDADGWARLAATPAYAHNRATAIRRLTAKLLADGVDPYLAAELAHDHNEARCRPPLPRPAVDALVDDVCEWRAAKLEGRA